MNDLAQYRAVRNQMQPGDLIVWWGDGLVSGLIRLFSAGPSHSSVVRQSHHQYSDAPTVFESTILDGKSGCQTNNMDSRLGEYDGSACWLPLRAEIRRQLNLAKFYAFIGQIEDSTKYDEIGVIEFLLRDLPIAGNYIGQSEHLNAMVCSAAVCAAWTKAGILRGINWSRVTPQGLAEMALYRECVPILGRPPKIRRFNTA